MARFFFVITWFILLGMAIGTKVHELTNTPSYVWIIFSVVVMAAAQSSEE